MKRFFNPEVDGEAILNILNELDDEDTAGLQIKEADELELILTGAVDGADSDIDDAGSDEEGTPATVRDLGKGILRQHIEVRAVKNVSDKVQEITTLEIVEDTDDIPTCSHTTNSIPKPPKRAKVSTTKKNRSWATKELDSALKFSVEAEIEPECTHEWREKKYAPIDVFRLIFDDEILDKICKETNLYAMQKGQESKISPEEIFKYFAILLLSGYSSNTHRRMYWETREDTHNSLVSSAMSRNRFELIHRYFHLNDNNQLDPQDRLYKVRPFIDHLNKKFQELARPLGSKFSLDEAMEPYYGHHYAKQFIRGKPIRYGFKFWCLNNSTGYLLKFEPYTGAAEVKTRSKPLGSTITEKLCVNFLPLQSTVYIDNYFSSLPLLESLKSENINCLGTIRSDRVEKAPLKDLKKEPRGSHHALQDNDNHITLVRWHDNSQVTIATNIENEAVLGQASCRRWDRVERKYKMIPQPTVVQEYNRYMGGVDLFDRLRGNHRIRIRSKKWYWPLIRFGLNGAVVNAWLLYRLIDKDMPLLEFTRRIALSVLTVTQFDLPKRVRPKTSSQILDEVRYDGINHLVDEGKTQRRCGQFGKCAKFICTKCNIGLHPKNCFALFHLRR